MKKMMKCRKNEAMAMKRGNIMKKWKIWTLLLIQWKPIMEMPLMVRNDNDIYILKNIDCVLLSIIMTLILLFSETNLKNE